MNCNMPRKDVCEIRTDFNNRYNSNSNNFNNIYNSNLSNFNQTSGFPIKYMYGHAYVPNQVFRNTFTPQEGLEKGTMFPELVSPYMPLDSMREIEFLRKGGRIY